MSVVRATEKGQVVIPVDLRKKYRISKGTRVRIVDKGGEIILKPLLKEPVSEGRGLFRKGPSALKTLMQDRKTEAKL